MLRIQVHAWTAITAIAGVIMAYTGFSDLAMMINMPASLLLLIWISTLGIYVWRKS